MLCVFVFINIKGCEIVDAEIFSFKENNYNFLMLSCDARAEEEYGLIEISHSIKDGNFDCKLEYIKYKSKTLPCLIINRSGYDLEKDILTEINSGEVKRKLDRSSKVIKEFEPLLKSDVGEDDFNSIWVSLSDYNKDMYSFGENKFISSFYYGKTLIILPNPFYSELPMKYFRKANHIDGWHNLKKVHLNSDTLKEFKKNQKQFFNDSLEIINKCFNSFKENGALKLYNHHECGLAGAIAFVPKEDITFTVSKEIFPYELSKDKKLVRKDNNVLREQIYNRAYYNEFYKLNNKKLENFNNEFKKKNLNYHISSIKRFDDGWFFWISYNSNIKSGWYNEADILKILE